MPPAPLELRGAAPCRCEGRGRVGKILPLLWQGHRHTAPHSIRPPIASSPRPAASGTTPVPSRPRSRRSSRELFRKWRAEPWPAQPRLLSARGRCGGVRQAGPCSAGHGARLLPGPGQWAWGDGARGTGCCGQPGPQQRLCVSMCGEVCVSMHGAVCVHVKGCVCPCTGLCVSMHEALCVRVRGGVCVCP